MEYFYKATTLSGKLIEGQLEAETERAVSDHLQERGYLPIQIRSVAAGRAVSFDWLNFRKTRVRNKDLLLLTQELATLLRSGQPLDRSLSILIELTDKPALKAILSEVLREVKGGKSLSESLAAHPKVFSKLYVNMVRAGEAGGFLNEVLERLVGFLEAAEELRSYLINAMIYPALLVVVGMASILVLLTFVIPKFTQIFQEIGRALPLPTVVLLNVSRFVTSYGWMLALATVGLILAWKTFVSTPQGRLQWDGWVLRTPLFGELVRKIEVSRFARTLGTLLHSAVPLLAAMNIVKEIIGNAAISSKFEDISAGIKKGEGVAAPVRASGVFPSLTVHLLEVGEETGKLDAMLIQVADTYDKEVRASMKNLLALLEPSIILVMGLIIGLVVLSMLVAIMSINEVQF